MFIGLLIRAMKSDLNLKRVAAFAKRVMQVLMNCILALWGFFFFVELILFLLVLHVLLQNFYFCKTFFSIDTSRTEAAPVLKHNFVFLFIYSK